MGQLNTDCLNLAKSEIVFFSNDDVIFKTINWDLIIVEEFKKIKTNKFLLFPNDNFKKENCALFLQSRRVLLKSFRNSPIDYEAFFIDLILCIFSWSLITVKTLNI